MLSLKYKDCYLDRYDFWGLKIFLVGTAAQMLLSVNVNCLSFLDLFLTRCRIYFYPMGFCSSAPGDLSLTSSTSFVGFETVEKKNVKTTKKNGKISSTYPNLNLRRGKNKKNKCYFKFLHKIFVINVNECLIKA